MKHTLAALFAVGGLALGCGGGDSPTTPAPRAFALEMTSESTIPAQAASCVGFRQEAAGEASASASLSTGLPIPIEMGAGGCTGSRTVVASGDRGAVTATLPAGDSFVRVENTSDRDARYSLRLRYLTLH
jgi:hypothetical protein